MVETDSGKEHVATEKRPGTIQSVAIATRFLELLANAEEPLTLGTLAKRAGTGGSTAHRYLQSLVQEGLAAQDPASGHYNLGPTALSIGIAALKRIEPVDVAARHMKSLVEKSPASGGVAIWTDRGPTLVRWYRSAYFTISSLGLGDVLPLDNTACGLMFQAFLPNDHVERARSLQPRHFRGTKPKLAILEEIRRTCRADLTSHLLPDITGQAVPVFDAQQQIACVMTTVTNLGQKQGPQEALNLLATARVVARETGGTDAFDRIGRDPDL
ncbi:IclR family transcriptional regulator [Breoghania corrubedonensis]|uniref:IclR family transcriptional regulator n=1 Tax=Breoghania corrubedonensis TaxID=665038 RepID=A0A2T5UYH5_9HYPH|nr:IclR family transcriptional regulator [Breoghania corrubedonensis]PTW56554.1 IclR family transcriptional regulator [Breoghania corrubedonensis]